MIQHTDLSKPIYDQLKQMIVNGELKPGEKIIQEKIASMLGVSRTPLMKALLILENELLIESVPRRGMFVKSYDLKEIIDVYICREAIEGMAARILAEERNEGQVEQLRACFLPFINVEKIDPKVYAKADENFHTNLIKFTNNTPLDKIYFFSNLHDKITGHGLIRRPEETLEEHFKLIDIIASGNPDLAESYAREHIQKSTKLLINQYKKQRGGSL